MVTVTRVFSVRTVLTLLTGSTFHNIFRNIMHSIPRVVVLRLIGSLLL